MSEFKIGEFQNPEDSEEEIQDKRKGSSPGKSLVEGIEEELQDDIAVSESAQERSKTYEDNLKEAGVSVEKAHAIIDDMLQKGHYEEVIPVTKTATVTFRTRSYSDYLRYVRALEIHNPRYQDEQQELIRRYFLAASLVAFKGKKFPRADNEEGKAEEKAFDERLEWIQKQPQVLIDLLVNKLNGFDNKVRVVMSEGVVENF